jgi:mRNA interferase RelE/StbE
MSHEVIFTATARRDLQRIPPRIIPAIIEFAFGDVADTPQRVGKPLERDLFGAFSARRGPYRVLCRFDEDAKRGGAPAGRAPSRRVPPRQRAAPRTDSRSPAEGNAEPEGNGPGRTTAGGATPPGPAE